MKFRIQEVLVSIKIAWVGILIAGLEAILTRPGMPQRQHADGESGR